MSTNFISAQMAINWIIANIEMPVLSHPTFASIISQKHTGFSPSIARPTTPKYHDNKIIPLKCSI